MVTFLFMLEDDVRFALQCPDGSPVPRVGETIRLPDDLLYDVIGVSYDFNADASGPDVTIRIDHF